MASFPKPHGTAQIIRLLVVLVMGGTSLFLVGIAALMVIEDISAGALNGTPETGWGFLIAMFLSAPAAICIGVTLFMYSRYRRAANHQRLSTPPASPLPPVIPLPPLPPPQPPATQQTPPTGSTAPNESLREE